MATVLEPTEDLARVKREQERLKEAGVAYCLAAYVDVHGIPKAKIVPIDHFERMMRGSELFMTLPWLYLLLAVRAFLPLHIGPLEAFFLLVAIIGGVGWVRPARLIRGVVLSARERPFVLAARGFGAGPVYLIRRHILPFTWPVTLTQATVLIPQYILAEVTLSFLGLGVGEPVPSWGNMLAEARQYHVLTGHAWLLAPGAAAIPVLLGYLLLADELSLENQEDRVN